MGIETALLVGAGASFAGSVMQGNSQANAAEYNAAMLGYEAKSARQKAEIDEKNYRKGLSRQIGSATSVVGGSGFGMDGTNANYIDEIRREGELDAAMIRHGGEMDAWSKESSATLQRSNADSYRTAGWINGISNGATMLSMKSSSPKNTIFSKTQPKQYRFSTFE